MGTIPDKVFHDTGEILRETYHKNKRIHRDIGPAVIWYYKKGQISAENYAQEGELHRMDGPAESWYTQDGSTQREYYYIRGKLHREDGPAEIARASKSSNVSFRFYKHGVKLDTAAFNGTIDPSTGEVLDKVSFELIYNML